MSTHQAFVQTGDWSAASDKIPALKWMHEYTNKYDSEERKSSGFFSSQHTDDFVYSKSTGQVFSPGQESFDQLMQDYAFFTSHYHEPYFVCGWERADGSGDYEMTGNAWLYANLPGGAGGADGGVKDGRGRSWEMKVPGGFHFVYRKGKGDGEWKLASTAITSDSGPVVVELLKRGVLKPADIGL